MTYGHITTPAGPRQAKRDDQGTVWYRRLHYGSPIATWTRATSKQAATFAV